MDDDFESIIEFILANTSYQQADLLGKHEKTFFKILKTANHRQREKTKLTDGKNNI